MAVIAGAVVINTGKKCESENKNAFIQELSVAMM